MTAMKKPWERLDALLGGIEEEVLGTDLAGTLAANEGDTVEEAEAMRREIESLIRAHSLGVDESHEDAEGTGPKGARTLERLGRWTRITERRRIVGGLSQVRMAFSGERKQKRSGSEVRRAHKRQRRDSVGGKRR